MPDDEPENVVRIGTGEPAVTLATMIDARALFDEALGRLTGLRGSHGPVADRLLAYQRAQTMARGNAELEPPAPDPELERDGAAAIEAIERAYQEFRAARQRLVDVITKLVRDRTFSIGDSVPTPYSRSPLRVATKYEPPLDVSPEERELCEVVLTGDGGRIEARQHNWALDSDGKRIDDGSIQVRYERWWAEGLRVGGTVHPITRRITATENLEPAPE